MGRIMTLHKIDPRAKRAISVCKILRNCGKSAIKSHGDDLAGFALVTWDMRGTVHTTFLTEYGIVSRDIMPCLVKDALNRHVAMSLAHECVSTPITDDSA